jgi:hypothetical protein
MDSSSSIENNNMTKRSMLLDRLNEVHSFPGPYTFKVIGTNSDEFLESVVRVVNETLGDGTEPDVSTRESSGGKHLSVTVSVEVSDAESVLEVYAGFRELDAARFVL